MYTIEFPLKNVLMLSLGTLQVYLKKWGDEIQYSHEYGDTLVPHPRHKTVREAQVPESVSWTRCAVGGDPDRIEIVPVMADKPVVVRPKLGLQIPRDVEMSLFVGIPIHIEITGGFGDSMRKIAEFPTVPLSKTWFGDSESGELCYSFKTKALRSLDETMESLFQVVCPVKIKNNSDSILNFQRICLHVEYLSLYKTENRLLANTVKVFFKGPDQVSQINLSPSPPEDVEGCEKIRGPRKTELPVIVKRSFYFLKYLTGL